MAAVLLITDRSVPVRDPRRFKNVLAVFPHADDETVHCGGSLARFAETGAIVTLLLLTRGERGNPAGENGELLFLDWMGVTGGDVGTRRKKEIEDE